MKGVSSKRNDLLDAKLSNMQENFEKKEVSLNEVLHRSDLEPKFVADLSKRIEETLEAKNQLLRNLK